MSSRNNLGEFEEQLIARYASGLKPSVQKKMQLYIVNSLFETTNMAKSIEKFSTISWKFNTQVGASTSKEGDNGEKGPLLDLPTTNKGVPLDTLKSQLSVIGAKL